MITFEAVTKRYPDGTVAVDSLDLDIPDGRVMVLVGPSGCGKTTTLRMINRLVEPTTGRVLIDGRDVADSDPSKLRRGIGYVIQQTGLFPHRTVEDNIATVPLLIGWKKASARARARELMDLVGLDPAAMAGRYPYQLSGGQQQRVGVARALAADPPVLLMDEPFSAVDPIVRAALQDELIRLQAELHKTVVLVTHDVEEAIKVGDLVAVFRPGGHLAQVDTPERLLGAPADDYVRDFVGFDRGIRRLSFFPAAGLDLATDTVLTAATTFADAITAGHRAAEPWLLVAGADGRPLGWAAVADLAAGSPAAALADAELAPVGHTFRPDTDSLRAALDATILSRTERAVGVDASGRAIGTTSYERLRDAIRAAEDAADAGTELVRQTAGEAR
ncbi:MAG TPA: ATP-binding cassette domain-containing protein [Streptosporangiaceae bacterium]|nr:ATP-binding cassette domain-containing protein [Streptosporangiaceae bacterium]